MAPVGARGRSVGGRRPLWGLGAHQGRPAAAKKCVNPCARFLQDFGAGRHCVPADRGHAGTAPLHQDVPSRFGTLGTQDTGERGSNPLGPQSAAVAAARGSVRSMRADLVNRHYASRVRTRSIESFDGAPRPCEDTSYGVDGSIMKRHDDRQRSGRLVVKQPVHPPVTLRTERLTAPADPRQPASVTHLAGRPVPQERRCK